MISLDGDRNIHCGWRMRGSESRRPQVYRQSVVDLEIRKKYAYANMYREQFYMRNAKMLSRMCDSVFSIAKYCYGDLI